MKKTLTRIGALTLALVLMLALTTVAFADQTLSNGEVGGYSSFDTPTVNDKVIKIAKEITAFNPDESYVYGPSYTYNYTVTAGTAGVSVTDATTDHASGVSSVTTTRAGITTGLKVNNTTGTTGTVVWANTDILDASSSGVANVKYLSLDFSAVVFTQPGVYRYTITETEPTDAAYTAAGITETTGTHVRYLDVYVMRSSDFDTTHDGTAEHEFVAGDWRVYGYVCVYNDNIAIVDGDTNHAVKTNGFVSGTSDGDTAVTADQYYTYNLTITKDLVGDNTMIDHQFPFEVAFDTANGGSPADPINGTFQLIVEQDASSKSTVTGTASVAAGAATVNDPTPTTGTSAAIVKVGNAQTLSATSYQIKVADGDNTIGTTTGFVKLIGIPYGVVASVTETNDNIGTTYTTSVKEDYNGSGLNPVNMTSTTGTEGTDPVTNKKVASIDYNETATRTSAASDHNIEVEFTNTLSLISPTGIAFRVAPYVLILATGIVLVALIRRRREEIVEA